MLEKLNGLPQAESRSTSEALAKIKAQDSGIHAWTYLDPHAASSTTNDATLSTGVSGMLFGVKDVIDVAGMRTEFGATSEHGHLPYADAWCVAALRRAGAIPVGKTVSAEFAFKSPGATRNPRDLAHTPGGSSSGSAAAVAAGMVPFALSTQTGGSIIRPAAYCGVFGFKPTFGLVPRNGVLLTCETLDVLGWHSDSIEVSERVAEVLLPLPAPASTPSIAELRYAVVDWNPEEEISDDARTELQSVLNNLNRAGAVHVDCSIDHVLISSLLLTHEIIMHYQIARSLYPIQSVKPDGLSEHVRHAIEKGLSISDSDYMEQLAFQADCRQRWNELTGGADIVISPSAFSAAPRGLSSTGNSALCKPWSVLGWPVMHLPTGTTQSNLPIGVQIISQPNSDRILMNWAKKIIQACQ